MHGIVFLELRKYAVGKFGSEVWRELVRKAGLSSVFYEASRAYPDADFGLLFAAVSEHAKATPEQTMRDFGHFVVPHLVQVFKGVISPAWRALDLLENIEGVVHPAARVNNPGATPPVLSVQRTGERLVIDYSSKRGMAAFGVGLVEAILTHYGEDHLYKVTCGASDGGKKARIIVVRVE